MSNRDLSEVPLIFPVPISFLKLLLNQKILNVLSARATGAVCNSRSSFDNQYFLINSSAIKDLILFYFVLLDFSVKRFGTNTELICRFRSVPSVCTNTLAMCHFSRSSILNISMEYLISTSGRLFLIAC